MKKYVKFIFLLIAIILLGILTLIFVKAALEELNIVPTDKVTGKNIFEFDNYSIEYGKEWEEAKCGIGKKIYRDLENKNKQLIMAYLGAINDQTSDYLQESNRQELYNSYENQLNNTFSSKGASMTNKSNGFIPLNNNFYYAFFEVKVNYYSRTYMILDANKGNDAYHLYGFQVITPEELEASDEQEITNLFSIIKQSPNDSQF